MIGKPMPPIELVYAVARNGVIGARNGLPWRIPSDLKRFRAHTMGAPIIMGRTTFEGLPRPLPGRHNIVVSTSMPPVQGASVVSSIEDALALAEREGPPAIRVIGGASIYRQMLDRADRLVVTHVDGEPEGDVTMPAIDADQWQEVGREPLPRGPDDDFATTLSIYERR